MKIFSLAGLGKDGITRLREIAGILAGFGFGELFAHIPFPGKIMLPKARKEKLKHPQPVRLRMALEELGTTYIKLGQFVSTRPDIVPAAYIKELSKLRDKVEPLGFDQIQEVLSGDWGDRWQDRFRSFSREPVGAASIAQVYKACLPDGKKVAVKVRRARIMKQVSGDLNIIMFLARFIERRYENLRFLNPVKLAEEFSRNLKRELDFKREAIIMKRFRQNHRDIKDLVIIPEIIEELSTEKILVMEFIEGLSLEKADLSTPERKRLARLGAEVLSRQILRDGFFHADPHSGNLLYTRDGRLSYLDFGMIGRLSRRMRNELVDLLLAAHTNEPEAILQELLILADVRKEVDRETLVREIMEVSDRYLNISLEEVSVGRAMFDIFEIIRRHAITVHPAYTSVVRAILTAEETARSLDSRINLLEEIAPQLRRLFFARYRPESLWVNARILGKDIYRFINDMPSQMGQIMRKLKTGQLEIEFRHIGLEGLIRALDRLSGRVSFSLVIASLIVGSSLIMHVRAGPFIFGMPALGFIGYTLSVLFAIWLLWSIIRSRKF